MYRVWIKTHLRNLASATLLGLGNRLDDTDSDSLSHVTDGETAERWIVREGLNAHGLGWNHLDNSSVTRLDELGSVFDGLASSAIDLLKKLREFASNVSGVAVKNRSITGANLTRVVEDNDLGVEGVCTFRWVVLGVTSNVTTADFLNGDVLDVEADVVTWKAFDELFMVHFNGLDFSGNISRSEGDDHTSLDDTSLNTTDRNRANARDLVDILKR
jgi:hypothetical protein